MADYGIPDMDTMSNAELEELLAEFDAVPKRPADAYIRAQGYMDIIRAELATRQRDEISPNPPTS
jgi:hypothetical protein